MFRNFAQSSIARKWSDSNSAPSGYQTRHLFRTVWTIVDYVPALFWTLVYRHSNIILRTSQSGRDDNRKVRLRESPARGWSLGRWPFHYYTVETAVSGSWPHQSYSCSRGFFFSAITFCTPRSSCTFLQTVGLCVSMAVQKRHLRTTLASLRLQVANKECNFLCSW